MASKLVKSIRIQAEVVMVTPVESLNCSYLPSTYVTNKLLIRVPCFGASAGAKQLSRVHHFNDEINLAPHSVMSPSYA